MGLSDPDPPDQVLVEQSLSGDRQAFGQLAERYYKMVWLLAYQKTGRQADADDISQEALVRAFRALETLRDGGKFSSWLYNITFKLCIDQHRRRGRRERSTVPLDEEQHGGRESGRLRPQRDVGEELEAQDEHDRVLQAVAELPEKYRVVITLRYVEKLSYKEIAVHLAEPAGTVANRLHRATRILQNRLGVTLPAADGGTT